MKENVQNSPVIELPTISERQQKRFKQSFRKVRNISFLGFGLGVLSESLGHNAPGFVATGMEFTDTGIVIGMDGTSNLDKAGKHDKAAKWRTRMFGGHIAIAGVGIAEAARLMNENQQPNIANVVIAGLIGVLNLRYLADKRKESKVLAAVEGATTVELDQKPTGFRKYLASIALHSHVERDRNLSGVSAIAQTNVAEAAGGIIGAGSYVVLEQGPATAAIVSSSAVIYIMARQIIADRRAMVPATA